MDRLVEIMGVPVAVLLGNAAGWGWTIAILALAITFVFARRAYILQESAEPKIVCNELRIQDESGEQYVRVSVHNTSSQKLEGLQASVERISDSEGTLSNGEIVDLKASAYARLDYPIQLFTQERLRDRRAGGDKFVVPSIWPQSRKNGLRYSKSPTRSANRLVSTMLLTDTN